MENVGESYIEPKYFVGICRPSRLKNCFRLLKRLFRFFALLFVLLFRLIPMKKKHSYQLGAVYQNRNISLKPKVYHSYLSALVALLLSYKRWNQMGYASELRICKID